MAISTVGSVFTVQDTNNTATISYTFGIGEGVSAGNAVILYLGAAGATTTVAASAADTKGNTYTVGDSVAPSGSVAASIASGQMTRALVAGDIITVTLSHTSTDKNLVIRVVTGQAKINMKDISAKAGLGGAGSTQPSVSSSPAQTTADGDYLASLTVWNGNSAMTAETIVASGDDIVAKVAAAPTNGVITIQEAEYRTTAQIVPKAGQKLLGEGFGDVVINCSKLLTGWTGAGPYVWTGTLPGPTVVSSGGDVSPANLVYPQSYWIDVLYRDKLPVWKKGVRVSGVVYGSAATPAAGECFVDYDAGTITYGSNPATHTMEMSQPFYGINGNLADVTVAGVTVFGSSLRGVRCGGDRWEVRRCELTGNYIGVSIVGANCNVHHNQVNYNVQLGINGNAAAMTITDNEAGHNDTNKLYRTNGNSANAGIKLTSNDGAKVLRNLVHHNEGPGIWFDISCINATVEDNESHDNVSGSGIHYEISYAAQINRNLLYNNGDRGLWISTSQNVSATGNKCWGNTNQNVLITDNAARTDAHPFGVLRGINNTLTSNEFWADSTPSVQATRAGTTDTQYLTTNHWVTNTHHQTSSAMTPYSWPTAMNQAAWIAKGNDIAGTFTNDLASPTYPTPTLSAPGAVDESNVDVQIYTGHFDNGGAGQTKQMNVREEILTTAPSLVQRSDTLAATQPWASVLVAYKADTSSPPSSVKTVPRGLSLRDAAAPTAAYTASFSNGMRRIYWDQIQPADTNTLDPAQLTSIRADLDAADAAGRTISFRIFAGYRSPTWLKTMVGTFKYADTVGSPPYDVVTIPKFWTSTFLSKWDRFQSLLAAQFDSHPALCGLQIANGMTYFAEPLLRHVTSSQNRAEMVGGGVGWDNTTITPPGAGFSLAADKAALKRGIDIHAAYWTNTPGTMAFNPYQTLKSQAEAGYSYSGGNQSFQTGDDANLSSTKEIIDYLVAKLGPTDRAILENNSVRKSYFDNTGNLITSTKYGQMYAYFLAKDVPLYYQLGNQTQVPPADFNATMRGCVDELLANAIEPVHNSGTTPYDAPNLAYWNGEILNNAVPTGGSANHVPFVITQPEITPDTAGYTTGGVLTSTLGEWDGGPEDVDSWDVEWFQQDPVTAARDTVGGPTTYTSAVDVDTYTLQASDLTFQMVSVVTPTNGSGDGDPAESALTPIIVTPAAPVPVNVTLPAATPAAPVIGDVITWSPGEWENTPTSFHYDIERSADSSTWLLIQSGSDATYATSESSAGSYYRATVIANNGKDSSPATSQAVGPVTAAPVITLTQPAADTVFVQDSTYTLIGQVLARGASVVSLTANGEAVTFDNVTGNFTHIQTNLSGGPNIVTLIAVDALGGVSEKVVTLYRDLILVSTDVADIEIRIKQRGLSG